MLERPRRRANGTNEHLGHIRLAPYRAVPYCGTTDNKHSAIPPARGARSELHGQAISQTGLNETKLKNIETDERI